jgi:uncharacterized protein (DUF3084 family)
MWSWTLSRKAVGMERIRLSALVKDVEMGGDIDVVIAADAQRALDVERERARVATQLIIETIGSSGGPEDLEEALGRMTAKLATLQARCAHLDVLLRDEYLPKLDVVAVQRSIADRDSRIDALEREVEKLDDDKETLQAQLADRDAMILQMGEQAAVLAKENMAVKAQLRRVEWANARLREALDKLARLGNEPYYGNSTGNVIAQQALADTDLQTNDQQKGA